MQAYSDPSRASEPTTLPDVEIFYISESEAAAADSDSWLGVGVDYCMEPSELAGWYWWACFPGCIPDGEPSGPFATEEEALADAQNLT